MSKDKLFDEKRAFIHNFDFGAATANVFDDMLDRSVPFYQEIQRMMSEMCTDFAAPGTNLYDLGCSTCTTFLAIEHCIPPDVTCVGVDSSPEMLEKAREKLGFEAKISVAEGLERTVEWTKSERENILRTMTAHAYFVPEVLRYEERPGKGSESDVR